MSTPNNTLAINIGSKNRGGTLYATIHMDYNDTCTMAVLRADAGKELECSANGILGIMTVYPKPVKDVLNIFWSHR